MEKFGYWSGGVLEYWSDGVLGTGTPSLQYSITPFSLSCQSCYPVKNTFCQSCRKRSQ